MKKYVRIHSTQTINVTAGLQNDDVTNPDAHVPDRLKINPTWPKLTMLVMQGSHLYPSEIVEWATVKALAKDKIFTIGEMVDDPDAEDEGVIEKKQTLAINLEEVKAKRKAKNLSELAGE